MTVFWKVDDLKVSHKNEFEITRFATYLQDIYVGLQASCVKVHEYLGMTLDYSEKGKLKLSMIPYLINLLKEFLEDLGALSATTTPDNVFKVRPEGDSRFLPEDQSHAFHHTVVQLLLLSVQL